jgi:hypothetical protein
MMLYVFVLLFSIKDFAEKSSDHEGPLFVLLGLLTNLSLALCFGKPYEPALLSVFGFFGGFFISLKFPALWPWSTKFTVTLIPLVMGVKYFYLYRKAHRF